MRARGKAGLVPLAFLLALSLCPVGARPAGAQQGKGKFLAGCGICYPEGYDVNTVGEVHGRVVEFQVATSGPVRIVVDGERERWVVLAAPAWFWNRAEPKLFPGDPVTVRGSKTLGSDGALYLVAREIWPPDSAPVVVLRDHRGVPLWSEARQGAEIQRDAEPGRHRGRSGGRR